MRVALILTLIILFSGCVSNERLVNNEMSADNEMSVDDENDNVELNDDSDPDVDNMTDSENNDSDIEEVIPKCLNQWEEVKTTDMDSFEFKLKKTTGLWSWKKDGEMEVLDYEGGSFPVSISEEGETVIVESEETESGYSVLAYLKSDGSYDKYVLEFKKESTINYAGFDTKKHLTADAIHNKEKEETLVVVNMFDKTGKVRPFLMKVNKNREVSYTGFEIENDSVCSIENTKNLPVLICRRWIETGDSVAPFVENLEIYSLFKKKLYRKKIESEDGYSFRKVYSDDRGVYLDISVYENAQLISDYIAVDSDMCLNSSKLGDHFLTDFFRLKKKIEASFVHPVETFTFIDGMFSQRTFEDDSLQNIKGEFSYFHFGDREVLFTLYKKKSPEEGIMVLNPFWNGFSVIDGSNVFKSGVSTIDLEDEGREWENETCQGTKVFLEYIDPVEKKVYARHFIKEESDCYAGQIFVNDEYIFYQTAYVLSPELESDGNKLFRMKKDWLINSKYEVAEKFLKIEDMNAQRDKMEKVVAISSGGMHTCSVNTYNHVFCWGDNSKEQQGEGWGSIFEDDIFTVRNNFPGPVDRSIALKAKMIMTLSSGYQHSCAVDDHGIVYCWGNESMDQLGNGIFLGNYTPRFAVKEGEMLGKNIIKVEAGKNSTCALDENGMVYCWGSNLSGQLGLGQTNIGVSSNPELVNMDGVLKDKFLVDVTVGEKHACALDEAGLIYCWGDNNYNQVGNGKENDIEDTWSHIELVPVSVVWNGLPPKIIKISAGSNHTCGLDDNGSVYCWGLNTQDQLGNYSENTKSNPVRLNFEEKFVDISAGFEHTCGVTDKHDAYCWGSNATGQLGNNSTENSSRPVKVFFDLDSEINSVSCGHHHTCAVDADGNTYCWGRNNDGQLGNRTYEDSSKPVLIK